MGTTSAGVAALFEDGDEAEVVLTKARVRDPATGRELQAQLLPLLMLETLQAGGILKQLEEWVGAAGGHPLPGRPARPEFLRVELRDRKWAWSPPTCVTRWCGKSSWRPACSGWG